MCECFFKVDRKVEFLRFLVVEIEIQYMGFSCIKVVDIIRIIDDSGQGCVVGFLLYFRVILGVMGIEEL